MGERSGADDGACAAVGADAVAVATYQGARFAWEIVQHTGQVAFVRRVGHREWMHQGEIRVHFLFDADLQPTVLYFAAVTDRYRHARNFTALTGAVRHIVETLEASGMVG